MLLQTGPPGSTEIMFGVITGVFLSVVVGYLVYRDAGSRGSDDAFLWGLGTGIASLLVPVIGSILAIIVYYLVVIRE